MYINIKKKYEPNKLQKNAHYLSPISLVFNTCVIKAKEKNVIKITFRKYNKLAGQKGIILRDSK